MEIDIRFFKDIHLQNIRFVFFSLELTQTLQNDYLCKLFDHNRKVRNYLYMKRINKSTILWLAGFTAVILLSIFSFFRIDLTTDKRYSISDQTQNLMAKVDQPLEVTIYMDGDLNPGFQRLKKATTDLLEELSVYSSQPINIHFVNPTLADTPEQREQNYSRLNDRGLTPTAVYERDKEGKSIQKIIFPWIELKYNGQIIPVCLLKNIHGNSGEDNLNISIENLEFEISDGIRRITNTTLAKIAFIEGHGELNDAETYDISKSLSRYFQIDRGKLGTDASILTPYKAIIIAKPTEPFTETEKYIIDQYLMNGGNILWLIDAVRTSKETLSSSGMSPAIELDLNLGDQLFRYGIRINPVILQDVQCANVPVNIAPAGESPQFEPTPWFFAPILLSSSEHPVTRNISEVRAEYCAAIDLVGDNKQVKSQLILATSDNTHIMGVPSTIDLRQMPTANDKAYFNMAYVPVAAVMEGNFDSNFANRMMPKEITNALPPRDKSMYARQIFVADGDIIRNETNGIASDSTTIPLGFDRYMNQQFGNKDFIQNAVLYLTDKDGWMQLRNRTLKLRLLNKRISSEEKLTWQVVNVAIPIGLLIIFGIVFQGVRRRRYTR